jgi:hypothetical protein
MMLRSISDADAPETTKASGRAITSETSNSAARGADDFLHDEGRVGAQHDHLAVRHVDDAHGAEGDGKPDRRQQQHRAERNAVPDVLRACQAASVCRIASRRRWRRLDLAIGGRRRGLQHAQRIAVGALAYQRDRLELLRRRRLGGTSTMAARASLMARLMRWSFSPASAWSRAGERGRIAPLEQRFGRVEPDPGLGFIRVSEPTAASIVPRRRLLTRTRSRSASAALPAALPVMASLSASWLPSALPMTTSLSDVRT